MRTVIIMRGIPGSGKSTMADILAAGASKRGYIARIHSTDDLCYVNGEYQWSAELAHERHKKNLENFKESLELGINMVICDNTNIKWRDYKAYEQEAKAHDYDVIHINMPMINPKEAAERTTHNVPVDVIERMMMNWNSE